MSFAASGSILKTPWKNQTKLELKGCVISVKMLGVVDIQRREQREDIGLDACNQDFERADGDHQRESSGCAMNPPNTDACS